MARKSAAALAVVRDGPAASPAPAPDGLTPKEADLWADIVESKPSAWFGPDSMPLLAEYVRAVSMCEVLDRRIREAMEEDAAVSEVKVLLDLRDKESRRMTSLATKLRLTQQSQYQPRSAATANASVSGKRPWQI